MPIQNQSVQVVIELGRAGFTVEQFVNLRRGDVVKANRRTSESLDILMEGRVFARGEVTVVNGKFCVRITGLDRKRERMKKIRAM